MASTFKRNLLIGYGLSLLLLIISAVASYVSIRNLLYNQELVNRTNKTIKKLDSITSYLKDAETGQRGFLLTGKDDFLEPYNGALEKVNNALTEVRQVVNDNPVQLGSLKTLEGIAQKRMNHLQNLINDKRRGAEPAIEALAEGKDLMDEARDLIVQMQEREQLQLETRTRAMDRFATATPTLIIIASLMAILLTVVSFLRVNRDFEKRVLLQNELQEKDREITSRLNLIHKIAEQISAGDYKTRVTDEGKDTLGSLAFSLNKMAESLDFSFTNLSYKEWQQSGIAILNEKMIGEKDLNILTYNTIEYLAAYTGSEVGAFYLANGLHLELSATIALHKNQLKQKIQPGEGLAGQCALSGKEILLKDISSSEMDLNHTAGSIKPKNIIAVPVFHEKKLKGVIELASLNEYTPVTQEFLATAAYNIGMAIHSARDNMRLQELLAETQAQSEELQSQHSELENINAELEAQAEKLQASDEELRVQQEELRQSNQELEERSRMLEEKNELILERNFDIQKKAEELALSTRYKSEFLANMSHELRTPLNSILLLSRLLTENHSENLTSDQVEYASVIQSSGKGLLTLIDEILDLSKIESGKMELQFGAVRLAEITEELDSLFSPLAKDKGIEFTISLTNTIPTQFETDRLRLQQILRNLVSNSLKFTKHGSVTLTVSGDSGYVYFAVKDTGIGIAADKQQTIFEAFQQADGSTRREFGGTGLGLSISRELAKLLGGEIRLWSELGTGSEFTLVLPIAPGPHQDKETVVAVESKMTEPPIPGQQIPQAETYLSGNIPPAIADDRDNISKQDRVILIIEDDTAFARSLLEYTRSKGYKGVVSVRGDEGIFLAKQLMPVGILLDLQLPIKNGWQVMDELKSDPVTKPIPIHMMSSHEVKTKSITKGAVDFINKPVAFEKLGEMFSKIEEALSRHPKKVLIVEENTRHAKALSYFLENFNISAEIKSSVGDGIDALNRNEIDCVILDMGIPAQQSYNTLEEVKKTPGLENLPIIIFTGKNLSHVEEMKIKQYADSIVIKTAHSYQRILDEVSLFLHLVEQNKTSGKTTRYKKLGEIEEVLKGKNVLVADDDVRNIFSITKSLENYGVNVISATDGKEALAQLAGNKIDLVLMDMMMPEMDGYESTHRIRQNPKFKKLPIIAVTAKAMTGDREKCINAGASDYITKPVDVDQLISLLRVWLYD